MTTTPIPLNGADLTALPSGALWYAARRLLCVSDLHLGKSERMARRSGALIPPYDSRETLDRLAQDISRWQPEQVICLGDNFDDELAVAGIADADHDRLNAMKAGRHWIWITGNHDPGPVGISGTWQDEVQIDGLTFRHIAQSGAPNGEISGHYHPKHRLCGARSTLTRRAFIYDDTRLILPAYGTYTGGLRSTDPAIRNLFGDTAVAVLTGRKTLPCPLHADMQSRRR